MTDAARAAVKSGNVVCYQLNWRRTIMAKFIFGFAVAVIVLLLAGFCYVRFGFMDPRADIPVNSLESKIAMPSLDAAVDRRAPEAPNSTQPTDENLLAGMKIYQTNCASCHGDVNRPHGMLAESLYPRAPQFLEDAPDMPEHQNFFIVQHGIRLSGMPAWKQVLSEQQIWQVITFLAHMGQLPQQISDVWRRAAVGSIGQNSATQASPMNMKDNPGMKMPAH
jgi:thiosulfate dehydrogenase